MGRRVSFLIVVAVLGGSIYAPASSSSTSRDSTPDFASNHEALASQLEQLISQSTEELKKLKEASLLAKQELAKYKYLLPSQGNFTLPVHSPKEDRAPDAAEASPRTDRFTQLTAKEPVTSEFIRNSLYATQPVSDPPQATISVDALENVNDVVKNATDVATFSDDGTRDFFEEELYRMKREAPSSSRLRSLNNHVQLLRSEIGRLMTHKPNTPEPLSVRKPHTR
ncbi:hypothetical protein X943_000249 [Babesia divergens]|uniref:Uncharacterized protein n=1 Tax=Babesia divergens TaxID=32595 RepID=A0AAD9LJ20_BABDI|nr:hypothetical protein X943_000249 [Babesia divergens]